jgi:hypothetical protein
MKTTFFIIFLSFILQTHAFSQSNEETVSVNKIEGSLLVPESKKAIPVVLIIAGSGPTDRNGNSIVGVTAQSYKLLAEDLAKNALRQAWRGQKRRSGHEGR